MPNPAPAHYRDAAGVWHRLAVRHTPDGAWEVIDRAGDEITVIDTLAGIGDGHPQAEAVARDYAAHHAHPDPREKRRERSKSRA